MVRTLEEILGEIARRKEKENFCVPWKQKLWIIIGYHNDHKELKIRFK